MSIRQVDFYTSVNDKELFACRLAKKVYESSQTLFVLLENDYELSSFSRRLWSLSDTSFVPHCIFDSKEAAETVIWLGTQIPASANHSVLLNLASKYDLALAGSFMRILEIIGSTEDDLFKARERFCFYRDSNFKIEHHNMGKTK